MPGVASAIVHLGRLPGVDRPALAIQMVTDRGPFMLLDIGATTDATGLNLAQYGYMGALYAERVLGVSRPTVALLSIGEEGGKGEQRVKDATALLTGGRLTFLGNVEGRDLPLHPADVVVCDASVGNVVMKFFEGLAGAMFDLLRAEFKRPPWGPIGYLFMRPGHQPHPAQVRLRATGRGAPAGSQRHGAHHPWPCHAADDRVRRRRRSAVGTRGHPGTHRGLARRVRCHAQGPLVSRRTVASRDPARRRRRERPRGGHPGRSPAERRRRRPSPDRA